MAKKKYTLLIGSMKEDLGKSKGKILRTVGEGISLDAEEGDALVAQGFLAEGEPKEKTVSGADLKTVQQELATEKAAHADTAAKLKAAQDELAQAQAALEPLTAAEGGQKDAEA